MREEHEHRGRNAGSAILWSLVLVVTAAAAPATEGLPRKPVQGVTPTEKAPVPH